MKTNTKGCLISLVGPTAAGKSALALSIARKYSAPILSCDSRQVFRGMDIGTAKVSKAVQTEIPHYFVDILDPDQMYNAAAFAREAEELLARLFSTYKIVIAVGGSTLYFHTLWFGIDDIPQVDPEVRMTLQSEYSQNGLKVLLEELQQADPVTYSRIDRQNPARVLRALEVFRSSGSPISVFRSTGLGPKKETGYTQIKIGLNTDRNLLYERIDNRVDEMLENGLLAEVQGLEKKGYHQGLQSMQTIGYEEVFLYLKGQIDWEECVRLIKRNSRRYAKRQMTYYKKISDIVWFEVDKVDDIAPWLDAQLNELLA